MAWIGIYQFGMGWDWTVSNIMFCFCLGDEGHDDWEWKYGKLISFLLLFPLLSADYNDMEHNDGGLDWRFYHI